MVDRRRLAKLKAVMQRDGIIIEQQDGSVETFSESPALVLEYMMAELEEGAAEHKGEEYEWSGETARLREALDGATDEARAEFYNTYTPAGVWAEEVRLRELEEE